MPARQAKKVAKRTRQQLLWIGKWHKPGLVPCALPLPLDKQPTRVYTLYFESKENKPPQLPFVPVHNKNAFIEDHIHDWSWNNGMFRYYSRVIDRPVWVLLEYDELLRGVA